MASQHQLDEIMYIPAEQHTNYVCSECGTVTVYGFLVSDGSYQPRCRAHLPPGALHEYWARRMIMSSQSGNDLHAHDVFQRVLYEGRVEGLTYALKLIESHQVDAADFPTVGDLTDSLVLTIRLLLE